MIWILADTAASRFSHRNVNCAFGATTFESQPITFRVLMTAAVQTRPEARFGFYADKSMPPRARCTDGEGRPNED